MSEITAPQEEVDKLDSILISIKTLLGINEDDTSFDTDVIIHINTYLMILNRLAVGEKSPFRRIKDSSELWSEFLENDEKLEAAKSYVYMRVRLIFDPPTNSFTIAAMKETCDRLEFYLNDQAESKGEVQNGTE